MLGKLPRLVLDILGYELVRRAPAVRIAGIPDAHLYRPVYSPWEGEREFMRYFRRAEPRTLVSQDRCYVLYRLLLQALHVEGDVWECGVYRGGTAAMMADVLAARAGAAKALHLFDTFEGMPEVDPRRDLHARGDFAQTSAEAVSGYVGHPELVRLHTGRMPESFAGLEAARIALAHVDVDLYQSVKDCLAFVWPRIPVGGAVVLDDYGFPSCPGARQAVDEFFAASPNVPLCLPTGQAIVFRSVP